MSQNEIPPEILEFFSDVMVASQIYKKPFHPFKYILTIMPNDFKKDDDFVRFTSFNSGSEVEGEILTSFLNKQLENVFDKLMNTNSKSAISYPKPKQIKDGYYGMFQEQLTCIHDDLNKLSKKHNFSYIFTLYEDETLKSLYKLSQNVAEVVCRNTEYFMDQTREAIMGDDIREIIGDMMDDDDLDDDDDMEISGFKNEKPSKRKKDESEDILDQDDEDFNNY